MSVQKLTVSSEQIADTWVPHIMAVKIPKRRASKIRNMRKTVVAGGDTPEHAGIIISNYMHVIRTR